MNHNSAKKYLTSQQASHMGLVSQRVQAIKRLAAADHDPLPVRSGLQLAIITLDMQKHPGRIGWHQAGRDLLKLTKPLLSTENRQ